MSSSTSSLQSSPPNHEQPPSPPLEIAAAPEQENLLHLAPRTWEEFLRIEPPATGLYEYVDGYVIWVPLMADANHVTMSHSHSTVLSCSQDVVIVHTPSVQLVNDRDNHFITIDHEQASRMQTRQSAARDRARGSSSRDTHRGSSSRDTHRGSSSRDTHRGSSSRDTHRGSSSRDAHRASSSRASSSSDPATIQSDMRHPDFAIMKPKTNSADNSGTSREPLAKKRIYFALPLTKSLLALVEITSHSTRNTDLNAKWLSYARSNVPMYIIIDRGNGTAGTERIIIGTLEPLGSGTRQSASGDTHVAPPASPRTTRGRRPRYPPRYYYRKVYSGTEIVDCPYYQELQLEARQLLDVDIMNTLSTRMGNEQRAVRRRAQVVEQELGSTRQELGSTRQELGSTRQELGSTRQELSSTRQDLSNERRKNDELSSKYNDVVRQLDEQKRKGKIEKNSRGGSSSKTNSPEHKKSRKKG